MYPSFVGEIDALSLLYTVYHTGEVRTLASVSQLVQYELRSVKMMKARIDNGDYNALINSGLVDETKNREGVGVCWEVISWAKHARSIS